jgi:hypothetical protein
MTNPSPARQWAISIAKYTPEIRAVATAAIRRIRRQLPGAVELVYDNYNALVMAFGPSERASELMVSIALYPSCVNLFFWQGARLVDPEGLLMGEGKQVRRIGLADPAVVDAPAVRALIAQAMRASAKVLPQKRRMVIRAVSEKQRARQPRAVGKKKGQAI